MKTLIVYYSQTRGNTKRIAEMIREEKDYDICRIETEIPYTGDYQTIVDQGQEEVNEGYKPVLKPLQISLKDYDRYIVMTPTWWYTMAPAMLSFLSENDFSGKTIVPVQTHGGWPGTVLEDIEKAANGAVFEKPFAVQFDSTGEDELVTKQEEIKNWITSL